MLSIFSNTSLGKEKRNIYVGCALLLPSRGAWKMMRFSGNVCGLPRCHSNSYGQASSVMRLRSLLCPRVSNWLGHRGKTDANHVDSQCLETIRVPLLLLLFITPTLMVSRLKSQPCIIWTSVYTETSSTAWRDNRTSRSMHIFISMHLESLIFQYNVVSCDPDLKLDTPVISVWVYANLVTLTF